MASTLQKLLRKSPPTRIIAALHSLQAPYLTALDNFHRAQLIGTKPEPNLKDDLSPLFATNLTPSSFSQIYPSFPFGFYLNPIPLSGLIPSDAEDVVSDDSGTVWADSVKKKRKKKMNKHKYKKLRKRLRRQT